VLPAIGVLLAGLALAATAMAGGASAPLDVREVADGVFVHQGQIADLSADNGGDIANIGFIVGERCVAVVDSGSTLAIGRSLLAAVRRRTQLPVCYVVNTHMHLDHVFGNAAFEGEETTFVAAARMPAALSARAEGYLRTLQQEVGEAAAGSRAVYPRQLVGDVATLELGNRRLVLKAWPTAHTDNDLTVYDEKSATLWTGDLLFERFLPIVDGSVRGWLEVIPQLSGIPARHLVPGHGTAALQGGEALTRQKAYLEYLAGTVRAALRRGRTLREVIDADDGAALSGWDLVERFHARNLSAAYTELEWED